ncbi:MAG: hypothetical protein D6746_11165 [Bacteroidetes bacterium]|nr:MAG: hypothetical protein D6746_11165 [Bacteroidota bacterium]
MEREQLPARWLVIAKKEGLLDREDDVHAAFVRFMEWIKGMGCSGWHYNGKAFGTYIFDEDRDLAAFAKVWDVVPDRRQFAYAVLDNLDHLAETGSTLTFDIIIKIAYNEIVQGVHGTSARLSADEEE